MEEKWTCQNCGKETPATDEGGHCERRLGWLCNDCIEKLKQEGTELDFEDDEKYVD